MKKISSYLLVGMMLAFAVSCSNSEYKKTKSGLRYKIISDKSNPVVKKGEFLKLQYTQKLRDSLLYSTYEGGMPVYPQVDSARPVYSPTEIFPLLRKGDSAVVVQSADTLQRRMGGQLPPFIKKKDNISITFKVLDVFTTAEAKQKDMEDELVKQKQREISMVEGYLSKNGIHADKTEKGTYVVVNSVGDGPAVDSGKEISVRYTGKILPSGKVFESNMTGPGNAPFKFVVGKGQIIPGWDDGLRKFKKGGKGTLYIPAFLAYDQQPGPDRKPFENLIFDVEIVDVTTPQPTPPAPPAGAYPQGMQAPPPAHR